MYTSRSFRSSGTINSIRETLKRVHPRGMREAKRKSRRVQSFQRYFRSVRREQVSACVCGRRWATFLLSSASRESISRAFTAFVSRRRLFLRTDAPPRHRFCVAGVGLPSNNEQLRKKKKKKKQYRPTDVNEMLTISIPGSC